MHTRGDGIDEEEEVGVEREPGRDAIPWRRRIRELLVEHARLAKVTAVLLAIGVLALVLWAWAGPDGSSSLQWAPLPAMMLVVVAGCALGAGVLLAGILTGVCLPLTHPIARMVRNLVLGVLVVAAGLYIALASLIGLVISSGGVTPRSVFGGRYYETNLGFPDPNYVYYESHGVLLMARQGTSTGENRAESDGEGSGVAQPPGSPAPQPDTTTRTDQESREETGRTVDLPIDPTRIAASGSTDGLLYGVAEESLALGGQSIYAAAVSDDGGATWERRGTIPEESSEYGYHVVDDDVQVLAFGSGSDDVAPPAYLTRDGGWTWTRLTLPVPADVPASAQFVEDVARDGADLNVTINYPTWVTTRGDGTRFVSHDDGRTWTLVSN